MVKDTAIPASESRGSKSATTRLDTPMLDNVNVRTAESSPAFQSSNLGNVGAGIIGRTSSSQQIVNIPTQSASSLSSPVFLNNFLPLLNQLLENMIIPFNRETEAVLSPTSPTSSAQQAQVDSILTSLRSNLVHNNEFIKGLALIKEILVHKEISGVDRTIVNTLLNNIEDMGRELTGQRLFNVMTKFTGDSNLNYYYLSFPVKLEDEYRLCQLKIDKKLANQALIEQDNVKIVVSLETDNLGYVLFHVDWFKKGLLKLQGVVESARVSTYLSDQVNNLINAIEKMGYMVDYQGIKIAKGEEEMRVTLQEIDEVIKPYVIDIRI